MKGSAAVISAHSLAQAALSLEMAGAEGKLENVDVLLADVCTEFEELKSFPSQSNWVEIAKQQERACVGQEDKKLGR